MKLISSELWLNLRRNLNLDNAAIKSSELNEDILIKGETIHNCENDSNDMFKLLNLNQSVNVFNSNNSGQSNLLLEFSKGIKKNLA